MAKTISIGTQSFEFIRKNDYFFIDKTGLIKEWWENGDAVTLITRPRRFGKTLNLDMLNCFFSRQYEGRGELFEGLSIWEEEKYRKLQGSCPVIFLSFADIKGTTPEDTKSGIKYALERLYRLHWYVRAGKDMKDSDLKFFDSVRSDMEDQVAVLALKYLSDYLSRYYGQKVLIFLDEYDTPLQEAYVYGYWEEMAAFIRRLFNSSFKTNTSMERAFMTGITRISRESIFSDLNNLTVITTTSESYRTQFGFTEEEVFHALDEQGVPGQKEAVKYWYDGFTFGSEKDMYNPWSITNYLKNREYRPYWANSSFNGLVSMLLRQGDAQMKMVVEDLMKGGSYETELDEEIIFNRLNNKPKAVWSLFLASGYLKVVEKCFSDEIGIYIYRLALTNREVELMFRGMVRGWFGADVPYNDFIKALLLDDVEAMNDFMNEIALGILSSFDIARSTAKNDAPERFYHGLVLGLMVELADRYELTSNRESGFGRYDIMLVPKEKGLDAMVIEFKVRKPRREASLEETVTEALKQIEDKRYDTLLEGRGFQKSRIRHYGFAFEGRQVLIASGRQTDR